MRLPITVNSLKFRLILSAILMTIIVLPIIGLTLSKAFEKQVITSVSNELSAYSYSLLAVAEVENQTLFMPEQLLENQLNVIQSGLYGLITDVKNDNNVLWHSDSLLSIELPEILPLTTIGDSRFSTLVLDDKKHFIFSFTVSFSRNDKEFPLTVHVIKNFDHFDQLVNEFQQQLWTWLFILMGLLFFIQSLWLMWTLKPLNSLKSEMIQVEQGQLKELQQEYPLELAQVTEQLNLLLRTERQQRQRYRNALSDLAHSLKTPLAVIQSQQNLCSDATEQLQVINQIVEHQLKRAQSAGESSWHLGIKAKPLITKLINTMEKIHHDKALNFIVDVSDNIVFKGDEADFLEIIGNLIDNACKAARSKIHIKTSTLEDTISITIADDGAGIPSDLQKIILNRGTRVDTYQQGHGIGLAIVRDLVDSYQGTITVGTSSALFGAEFVLTFTQ